LHMQDAACTIPFKMDWQPFIIFFRNCIFVNNADWG
jgi:hypothetical protein